MLEHVIDNKKIIITNDSSIIDLTTSIFDNNKSIGALFNVYRVPESMKMRIDLISLAGPFIVLLALLAQEFLLNL